MAALIFATLALLAIDFHCCSAQQSDTDDDSFSFTNGPVPDPFTLHQHYPDRPETVECRPIRLQIPRGSRRFRTELVTNDHSSVHFAGSDARVMSLRLRRRVNELAEAFHDEYGVWVTISKAWVEEGDGDITDPTSLHFEGRSVRVSVDISLVSSLLQIAVEIGFDWVFYANENYAQMSVIPNLCDVSLDMVFMLDRSGSVGETNFNTAISFLQSVVGFYDISSDATRVGLVTYSTGAAIEFDLNDHTSVEDVQEALSTVPYTKGWTATALALALARFMMDPLNDYGARPFQDGIPKVAVLLTDGRSNQLPINDRANALRDFGVQVYTVGIGDVYLPELKFIASDPDNQHVFLLDSFNNAQSFVDFLSITTCDAPAVVDPGQETRNEIEEDEFRFFESRCEAFSDTVMIEQIDLVGLCSLYASWSVQNPGPLDPPQTVLRNEDTTRSHRSLHLSLPQRQDRFVYVSVRGRHQQNQFSIVIWDMIFEQDEYTITVLDDGDTVGQTIINLVDQIRNTTSAMFNFEIRSGNEEGFFLLDPDSGVLTAAISLSLGSFSLYIVAQNKQHDCHRAKVIVNVVVMEETLQFEPFPQPETVPETIAQGTVVTQVIAVSSSNEPPTYSITAGDPNNQFSIDSITGEISVRMPLDFEVTNEYSLTVQARGRSSTVVMAIQIIQVEDVNEQPIFITECAVAGNCEFLIPEGDPVGTFVGQIEARDPDIRNPQFSMLTYGIEPQQVSVPFQISNTGEITTTETLDFETVASYSFTVFVEDSGNPPSPRIQTQVTVNVENIVENAPPVFLSDCSLSVEENAISVDGPVVQCDATDADHEADEIEYTIIGGNIEDTFRVDPTMGPGILVLNRNLDREDIPMYNLTLQATDPDGLSGTTMFDITVEDLNDSPPACTPPSSSLSITSLPGPQDTIATFTAVDPDIDPAPPVFSIESQETAADFLSTTVTVRATDGENSNLFSTCSLTVEFQDICELQQYSIDSVTGQLTAALLCSAFMDPGPEVAIELDGNRIFTCEISANVETRHQFFQNETISLTMIITTPLILRDVGFERSGEYTCHVTNDQLGTIISSPTTVRIEVGPSVVTPPVDVTVPVGDPVSLECAFFGVPEPDIVWLGPDSQNEVDTSDTRIQTSGGTLTINSVQASDAGLYVCEATNDLGTDLASATLSVVLMQQLVRAEVPQYLLPSQDGSCHEFNSSHFNDVMTTITGHKTLTAGQESDDLCPPSPCNPSPCQNGGTCVTNDDITAPGGFTCQCPPQFTGHTCGEVIDPCNRTPCRNGGSCASDSLGEFFCYCSNGYHGDRCQYTDVCSSSAPCQLNEMCLETVVRSEGYVCLGGDGEEGGSGVRVTVDMETTVSTLDGQVNLYIETAEDTRQKREASSDEEIMEENGFVNICEGRFVASSPNTLRLVWACPVGVASPGREDEEAICALLIRERLVSSCLSPQGGRLEIQPVIPLPPTSVNITFVLLDSSTGNPLSAADVLDILEETDARNRLNNTLYKTERFTAVTPSDGGSSTPPDKSGAIIGAVIGTVTALVLLSVVAVVTVFIIRRRKRDKRVTIGQEYQQNGYGMRESTAFSNHYTSVPQCENGPRKPLTLPSLQLPTTNGNGEPTFDNPVYDARSSSGNSYHPPATEKRRSLERGMRTSLDRGMKLIRSRMPSMKRSDSASGLLSPPALEDSGDYDDIIVTSSTTPTHVTTPSINNGDRTPPEEEESIYANTAHSHGGAMGNAGQRWESYQQNRTLLRTDAK